MMFTEQNWREELAQQTRALMEEFLERSGLRPGQLLVVGCSTSEVVGARIGSESRPEVAQVLFQTLYACVREKGICLAAQCCEHLNRALIIERADLPVGAEIVNVVPQPKAGGSFATQAYESFTDPVAVEEIRADAGLDIGMTLIGMHLRKVAVPLRLEHSHIGEALVIAARTRPKCIGGVRAHYDETLL